MADAIRMILAAILVIAGAMTVSGVVSGMPKLSPLVGGLMLGLTVHLLAGAAHKIFNRRRPSLNPEQKVGELKEQGLLLSNDFRAIRVFQVEERNDEGPHYFLELEDKTVLYLGGEALYDYEPIDDDPEFNRPRRFPCSEFTVRQHPEYGVVDILCRGHLLQPESVLPFKNFAYFKPGLPSDFQVITDRTYDEIREYPQR